MQGTAMKPSSDLIAGHPPIRELPASDHTMLPLGQHRDHEIRGQRRIRVTLGVYIAPNVARVKASGGPWLHEANAAGPRRVDGALGHAFAQQKRLQPAGTASGFDPLK
jgi:hypothetical protein